MNEAYYCSLIKNYYGCKYPWELKNKYKLNSYKDIYFEMDRREKKALELQAFLHKEGINKILIKYFNDRKDGYNSLTVFKCKIKGLDTTREIDARTYAIIEGVMDTIKKHKHLLEGFNNA